MAKREGYRTVQLTAAVNTNFPGEVCGFEEGFADKLIESGKAKPYQGQASQMGKGKGKAE